MTEKGKRHTFERSDIIDQIIRLRLDGGLSRTSILKFLTKEMSYSQSYSYELIREAAKEFEARAVVNFGEDLKEDIERFEKLYEKNIKSNNLKEARETLKEISKLKGHYKERIEINGQLDHTIQIIKLNGPNVEGNEQQ